MAETATTYTTSLPPEIAAPYISRLLGKTEATTAQPYTPYPGERTAQFTPLQLESFRGAETMRPAWQQGTASEMAGLAGFGALKTQYDPFKTGQFTPEAASTYMSPYMQNVVDIEKREAGRQSEIQRQQEQSRATAQGAYGGARSAIVEAERQRNLAQQQGDIQSRGLQAAYEQAANRFLQEQQLREQSRQYGAGLGLQGIQTALQGAGTLGTLGGQQFQQGLDINKLQQQYGTQQQKQIQDVLTQQYQDFLAQKQYPYQQLSFMSDILRGTPLTGQGVQATYTPPPSTTQTLTSGLLGAAGLYSMLGKAEGGEIHAYEDGGEIGANSGGYFGDDAYDTAGYGLGGIALNRLAMGGDYVH